MSGKTFKLLRRQARKASGYLPERELVAVAKRNDKAQRPIFAINKPQTVRGIYRMLKTRVGITPANKGAATRRMREALKGIV